MELKDLAPNPKNPRKISDAKLEMLKKSIEEFGDLSGIIYNRRTKRLVGGHQRVKVLPSDANIVIEESWGAPTRTGTMARGRVVIRGESFVYREVDWSETQEKAANIAANQHGGEWDLPALGDWLKELEAVNLDMDLIGFDAKELNDLRKSIADGTDSSSDLYTKKIESPIYEPTGEKPNISDLMDLKKSTELILQINQADIPDDIKEFLRFAASRHNVFNYALIAEYYAHAPKEVQRLMEQSALVIIDFKQAIENGFVLMAKELAESYPTEES